ncbi:MAG: chemotaxis protein CheB [Halioglobus sp.]
MTDTIKGEPPVLEDSPPDITDNAPGEKLFWVGIGASAGGLEALRDFVSKLPIQGVSNVTFIVAQHLSPEHQSMMVQLLSRETDLKIVELKDNQKPEPNVMYITPPNSDVLVDNGVLRLRAPMSELTPKPSVDYFFATLAEDQGDHAIGVILSGTGSDGSHGVRAIRAAGGLTMAQQPTSAKYDGMPSSAIATGCVDVILTAKKLGSGIAHVISSPRNLKLLQEEHQRTDIQELLFLVKQRSGVDFKDYKAGTLHRRISRRMAACGTPDLTQYLEFVAESPPELDNLYGDILISVTNFFRDTEAFSALKEQVESILAAKDPGDGIRVWVPGCATGEEAYSVVILFAEAAGGLARLQEYNFQMFATDLDSDILSLARKGQYAEATLDKLTPELREKYFRHKDGAREIVKGVRDMVLFSRHNVLEDPPFMRLDLVSCRNLLIYFNSNLQLNVLGLFHYALSANGILFLGQSETLGQSANLFQTVDSKAKIYRRKLISSRDHQALRAGAHTGSSRLQPMPSAKGNSNIHELPDALIAALAPNSLLVDESLEVVRIYGNVQSYTQLSPGGASMNLVSIARREFRQELRALAYKTLRESTPAAALRKKMKFGSEEKLLEISVKSLKTKTTQQDLLLISFEQIAQTANADKLARAAARVTARLLLSLNKNLAPQENTCRQLLKSWKPPTKNFNPLTKNYSLPTKSFNLPTKNLKQLMKSFNRQTKSCSPSTKNCS